MGESQRLDAARNELNLAAVREMLNLCAAPPWQGSRHPAEQQPFGTNARAVTLRDVHGRDFATVLVDYSQLNAMQGRSRHDVFENTLRVLCSAPALLDYLLREIDHRDRILHDVQQDSDAMRYGFRRAITLVLDLIREETLSVRPVGGLTQWSERLIALIRERSSLEEKDAADPLPPTEARRETLRLRGLFDRVGQLPRTPDTFYELSDIVEEAFGLPPDPPDNTSDPQESSS